MPAPPTVSVVLIVKNGAKYIADAIASVFESVVQPLEVVVVDGGSTDETRAIASRHPRTVVIEQATTGIANAYNEGIAQSRGECVAFVSHDDMWLPGKLDCQLGYMMAHPEVDLCLAHVQFFLEEGAKPPDGFRPELLDGPRAGMLMETLLARREAFATVGPFDSRFSVSEDADWFSRARDAGVAMAVLPETLVRKRVHENNVSHVDPQGTRMLLMAMRGAVQRKRPAAPAV